MPRGNFNEAAKGGGGAGFRDGYVRIEKSVSKVFQFPPNSKTGEQSDPFCALVWTATKLDSEWNDLPGDEEQNTVEIVVRMGDLKEVRPGMLDAKDFDDADVEPEDLGDEVGTEGNSFFMEPDKKFNQNWGRLKDSMEARGFNREIMGRGVTLDFVGMVAHFKTVEGEKYIAKQGKRKGEEVTPSWLECDRIHTMPYDAKKGGKKAGAGVVAATKPNGKAVAAGKKAAEPVEEEDATEKFAAPLETALGVFNALGASFKKTHSGGKTLKRSAFQQALSMEMMRQKVGIKDQKPVLDMLKDDEGIMVLASKLAETAADCAFTTDGETVSFE